MIGLFGRRIEGTRFNTNELTDISSYSMLRPCGLLLPTQLISEYAKSEHTGAQEYTNKQEAHCNNGYHFYTEGITYAKCYENTRLYRAD